MKFSCLQENLSQGLNINSHLAGTSKTTLPILNNILLSAEKNNLKLTTTNLEIAIETKIRAKIEKQGKITIPAQLFTNYINLLPNKPIDFELIKDELTIKSEDQEAKIKGISSEEFPIIPSLERNNKNVIKSEILKNALEKTIFAISSSEIRNELSGALFSFNNPENKNLTIVGTDSYRLTEKQISLEEVCFKEKTNFIIPLKTLQEVLRIIKEKSEIEIYLTENQILFKYQETEIFSRIINGDYPDYQQTIPKNNKTQVIIEKEKLLRAVKTASFFSKTGINDINLKISSKKNNLIISSINDQIGENKTVLDGEVLGEDVEIVFNYRYLIEGLNNLSENEIKIQIVNDDTPGIFKNNPENNFLYLIMPIKNN